MKNVLRRLLLQLLMMLGVYVGVAVLIAIDVNLSLATMDYSNPSALPDMGPELRYFIAIPVFGTLLAAMALVVNFLVNRFHRRTFHPAVWFCFGLAYSLPTLFLVLGHLYKSAFWLPLATVMAAVVVAGLRVVLGNKPIEKSVMPPGVRRTQ